jgi:hypothetical protein
VMKRSSSEDESTGKRDDGGEQLRKVKVLLADDHTMFREGLAGMLLSSYADEVEVVDSNSLKTV